MLAVYREGLAEVVRDEAAQVVGDGAGGFADAETGAVLIDHPEAEDGVAGLAGGVGEYGVGCDALADERAAAIGAGVFDGLGVGPDDRDVGALAGVQRLADVGGKASEAAGLEVF